MPPEFQEDVLDYVDLDIDILLWKNGKPIILDEDEYSLNSKKFQYPAIIDTNARSSLKELSSLIKKRKFPFDKDYWSASPATRNSSVYQTPKFG